MSSGAEPLWEQRWHPFREEWVLFTAHRGGRTWICELVETGDEDHSHYPFHLEFHPPLRQPDTLKYLAGPEIGGGQHDQRVGTRREGSRTPEYLDAAVPERGRAMNLSSADLEDLRRLLCRMQDEIRDQVVRTRDENPPEEISRVVEVTRFDTIYQIDRVGEAAILDWFRQHWPARWPAERVDLDTKRRRQVETRPSTATDLLGGFASFARFFPEAKGLLAEFEECLWNRLYVHGKPGDPLIFDDQYICTALIAQEAGCPIGDPRGQPLDAPLDTVTPVAWIGFANQELEAHVRSALDEMLERYSPSHEW